VANQGFINQYGTVRDPQTGKLALNATHISLWGALYFVTAICIQAVAPYTADRFGRKFNMWGITFFITAVSLKFVMMCCLSDISLSLSSSNASPKHGGRS
jgi:MFS family permease